MIQLPRQEDRDRLKRFLEMPEDKQIAFLKHVDNARRWRAWLRQDAAHKQVADSLYVLDNIDGGCEEWT